MGISSQYKTKTLQIFLAGLGSTKVEQWNAYLIELFVVVHCAYDLVELARMQIIFRKPEDARRAVVH